MSFDRLQRPLKRKRSPGHKLKPSRPFFIKTQNLKPTSTMKRRYYLGLDVAKQKIRAALATGDGRLAWEADLPVSAAGVCDLLAQLHARTGAHPGQVLVLVEATGVLHLNWAAALKRAGYCVAVINPLIARRLYRLENALRDSKTDPIDARGLCQIAREQGEALLKLYGFALRPAQLTLQRLQTVRHALRRSLTNCKKTYRSLLDLSFPELEGLLQIDGIGIRQLLSQAPTPALIARKRLATLQKNWMLRPKAKALKALAASSIADPDLAAASAPALQAVLAALAETEARLRALDRAIAQLTATAIDPKQRQLIETIPGFGPLIAAQVFSWLPTEILVSDSRRKAAARLQAFMGNDPRLKQSGQYIGQTKMSKRGVALLRTAFFQAAFSASQSDLELRTYYLRKRAQGHEHKVALSHLMRILTRRLVAVLRSGRPYQSTSQPILANAA
jgi:transposase